MTRIQQAVFDHLDEIKINYYVINHPPIFTTEEGNALGLKEGEFIVKNLFLRDEKKKRFFLVVLKNDRIVDLKSLREKLSSRPLSFASETYLKEYLNLEKGSVTPLGVLNDENRKVEVVFDSAIENFKVVGVHPNENTAIVFLSFQDLKRIIENHGNAFSLISVS